MRYLLAVMALALSFATFNFAVGGDSSGGGHARAIEFKKAATVYLRALRAMPEEDRKQFGVVVTESQLEEAIYRRNVEIRILVETDTLLIDVDRGVRVEKGCITEGGNPKHAYYHQTKNTIYVGVDWNPKQTDLALKEFLRTIDGVEAEKQVVSIASWYDSIFPDSAKIALADINFDYETKIKNYRKEHCEAAVATLKPAVTRPMYNRSTYEEMAVRTPLGDNLPLYSRSALPKPWDYAWVPDLTERARRKKIHEEIWKRSQEARASIQPIANVRAITEYLEDKEMSDTATQALGYIGHPSAAEPLMALIRKDIEVVGTDEHYQEYVHHNEFWAPQALGSLDYSRSAALYRKAEATLFELLEAQSKVKFGISGTLDDGFILLKSTRVLNRIRAGLESGNGNMWTIARQVATIKDFWFLMPVYQAAIKTRDERDFAALIKAMAAIRGAFAHRGINQSMVFADLVNHAATLNIVNGDVLIGLVHLRPTKCE